MKLLFSLTGLVLFLAFSLHAQERSITLALQNAEAKAGETVCLDVTAADFRDILSMQYSINWDASSLLFKKMQGFGLPGMGRDNFGTHKFAQGQLTFLWLDMQLRGISVPDGHVLFQVCFEIIGKRGHTTSLSITGTPTPTEVVGLGEKLLGLQAIPGTVRIN